MSAANARMTIGALLGTASNAANMFSTTFNTMDNAIGMLSTSVEAASIKQKARVENELATYDIVAREEAGMRLAQSRQTILDFRNKSQNHADLYDQSLKDLDEALAKRRSAKTVSNP